MFPNSKYIFYLKINIFYKKCLIFLIKYNLLYKIKLKCIFKPQLF